MDSEQLPKPVGRTREWNPKVLPEHYSSEGILKMGGGGMAFCLPPTPTAEHTAEPRFKVCSPVTFLLDDVAIQFNSSDMSSLVK